MPLRKAMHQDPARLTVIGVSCVILNLVLEPGVGAQAFKAESVRVEGRICEARAADLDGDGWQELLVSSTVRREREMKRTLGVYGWTGKGDDAKLMLRHVWDVSPEAVFWDTGPANGTGGGNSCYFLSPEGLFELRGSGDRGLVPSLRVDAPVFVSVGQEDEFLWLDAIRDWDGDGHVEVCLPLGREARFYRQSGAAVWEMVDSVRLRPFPYYNNNYLFGRKVGGHQYVAILFYPLLEPADLNGDGRRDLLVLQNGKGLGYLRGPQGRLEPEPLLWDLEIRTEEEIVGRRATLTYRVVDLNRDGCADVAVHKIGMRFMSWSGETAIFLGRADALRPKEPDQRFASKGFLSGVSVEDLDGDGYGDISLWSVKMGLWPMVEILLRKAIHLNAQHYYGAWPEGFSARPTSQRDFELHIDADRPDFIRGLVPNMEADFNRDGIRDLVASGGGDKVALYLGTAKREFASQPWVLLDGPGVNYITADDLDGNGGCDLYGYQVEEGGSVLHIWLQAGGTP